MSSGTCRTNKKASYVFARSRHCYLNYKAQSPFRWYKSSSSWYWSNMRSKRDRFAKQSYASYLSLTLRRGLSKKSSFGYALKGSGGNGQYWS